MSSKKKRRGVVRSVPLSESAYAALAEVKRRNGQSITWLVDRAVREMVERDAAAAGTSKSE